MKNLYHGALDSKIIWTPASNDGTYTLHRIPGIVVTKKDTVIIYCEARDTTDSVGSAGNHGDWCRMDIFIQRSEDGGDTFGDPIYISRGRCAEDGNEKNITINNPVMIVGNDNILHLLYCRDYCINGGGLWYTRSIDDGRTWSAPREVTSYAKEGIGYDFNCFAFGPTHGICTSKGILMTAIWAVPVAEGREAFAHGPSHTHVFYSTDNGETWNITKKIGKNENETAIAELSDGSIMINSRMNGGRRGINICRDFTVDKEPVWWGTAFPDELVDPGCCGGMLSVNIDGLPRALVTVNCADPKIRRYVTVKCSFDDGRTYSKKLKLTENYGGYCDIAVDSNGRMYVLWETAFGVIVSLSRFSFADEFCIDKK